MEKHSQELVLTVVLIGIAILGTIFYMGSIGYFTYGLG